MIINAACHNIRRKLVSQVCQDHQNNFDCYESKISVVAYNSKPEEKIMKNLYVLQVIVQVCGGPNVLTECCKI